MTEDIIEYPDYTCPLCGCRLELCRLSDEETIVTCSNEECDYLGLEK